MSSIFSKYKKKLSTISTSAEEQNLKFSNFRFKNKYLQLK